MRMVKQLERKCLISAASDIKTEIETENLKLG